MIARANGENSWSDPHNGGTYTFTSTTSTDIAGQRVTGDAKYTDKFDFHFEADGTGCKVRGGWRVKENKPLMSKM